jgi:hypothetical protein
MIEYRCNMCPKKWEGDTELVLPDQWLCISMVGSNGDDVLWARSHDARMSLVHLCPTCTQAVVDFSGLTPTPRGGDSDA